MADARAEKAEIPVLRVRFHQRGHHNGLRVVHDHSLHELNILR